MGGDDLGSDDEYLAAPPRGVEDYGDDSSAEDDDDNEDHNQQQHQKRRRGDDGNGDENNDATTNKDNSKTTEPTQRKSKKRGGPMEVLGSKIRLESAESKAEILSRFSGATFQSSHIAKLSSKNKRHNRTRKRPQRNFVKPSPSSQNLQGSMRTSSGNKSQSCKSTL